MTEWKWNENETGSEKEARIASGIKIGEDALVDGIKHLLMDPSDQSKRALMYISLAANQENKLGIELLKMFLKQRKLIDVTFSTKDRITRKLLQRLTCVLWRDVMYFLDEYEGDIEEIWHKNTDYGIKVSGSMFWMRVYHVNDPENELSRKIRNGKYTNGKWKIGRENDHLKLPKKRPNDSLSKIEVMLKVLCQVEQKKNLSSKIILDMIKKYDMIGTR